MKRFCVILLVAGLFAVAGCGASKPSGTGGSSSATTPSATSPPGATATEAPPAGPPAGGPVPPGSKATSVTFISPATAFVLGTAPCGSPPCSVILRTSDRGRSWVGLPAPREAVSSFLGNGLWGLRFADAQHGYAFGNGFWQTANGGMSWRRGTGPARLVFGLEAVQDRRIVALASQCLNGQPGCQPRLGLYQKPIASGSWKPMASTDAVPFAASIAVHGATVWALAGNRLFVSTDGGASFSAGSQPCAPAHPGNGMPTSITGGGQHTYLLCAGSGAAGSVDKFVFRGSGSSSWTRTASPPRGGDPVGLAAGSDSAVVVAATSGASELYRSADGGRSWRAVVTENDGGVGWADLGFTTPIQGVVVHGPAVSDGGGDGRPGRLLLTDDGGQTWHRIGF